MRRFSKKNSSIQKSDLRQMFFRDKIRVTNLKIDLRIVEISSKKKISEKNVKFTIYPPF